MDLACFKLTTAGAGLASRTIAALRLDARSQLTRAASRPARHRAEVANDRANVANRMRMGVA
jgi:hypothetical protein